jgi:hypothetical protein
MKIGMLVRSLGVYSLGHRRDAASFGARRCRSKSRRNGAHRHSSPSFDRQCTRSMNSHTRPFKIRPRDRFCLMSLRESAREDSSFIETRIWLHRPQNDVKRSMAKYPRDGESERAANGCRRSPDTTRRASPQPKTASRSTSHGRILSVEGRVESARKQPPRRIDRLKRSRRGRSGREQEI